MELIKRIFKKEESDELKSLGKIIENYRNSKIYKERITSEKYFLGEHDILMRKQYAINSDGGKDELRYKPNNRVINNLYNTILEQKVNYMFSKECSIVTENEEYLKHLNKIFNNEFNYQWLNLGYDVYKYGTAFLYVYIDNENNLRFKRLNSLEIIPIFKDAEHTELEQVIRIYKDNKYYGNEDVEHIEIYTKENVKHYLLSNGRIDKLEIEDSYIKMNEKGYHWGKIPIIFFRNSPEERPLLNKVKTLQDGLNELYSDFKNTTEENTFNTILVIKGYNDVDGSLRHNLNQYGYLPIGTDGDVKTLENKIDHTKFESIINLYKRAMYENAKGFEAKLDSVGANPNQMNIQSMYSDIDLDSNSLEREFKLSFDRLMYFVDKYLKEIHKVDYKEEKVGLVFNRDIMINESQAIDDCLKSTNVVSRKTLIENHPWVSNVDVELKRIDEEMEKFEYSMLDKNLNVKHDYHTTRPINDKKELEEDEE